MSQIVEFAAIAEKFGLASLSDHISNYFEKTGRLADESAIKSLTGRLLKELRYPKGRLHKLVGGTIRPSERTSHGRQATWSSGIDRSEEPMDF